MNLRTWLRRGLGAGMMLAGIAALPLAVGLARVAPVAAQGPSFQIVDSGTGAPLGIVEVDGFADLTQLVVSLQGAAPNTTFVVAACTFNGDGSTACPSDPASNSITTDANGNAQKLLEFRNLPMITLALVTVTSSANANAVAVAAVGINAPIPGPFVALTASQ